MEARKTYNRIEKMKKLITSNRIKFRIPIGDWSADGHSQCDWFFATAAKSLNDVREAYFNAKKNLPKEICPETFVCEYENSCVPKETVRAISALGFKILPDDDGLIPKDLDKYIVWFINKGDPSCDVQLEESIDDMLMFYGLDDKGRHIGGFGYGLFFS